MPSRFTGAVLAVVALVALDAPQTGFPASAGSAGAQSYVYNAKGRLLGHIERTAPGNWWVSDSFNSSVELVATACASRRAFTTTGSRNGAIHGAGT